MRALEILTPGGSLTSSENVQNGSGDVYQNVAQNRCRYICSRQTQAHCALASSTHKKTAKCLCNFSFVIISECSCPRLSRPLFTCHGTTGSSTQCQAHLSGSSVRDVSSGLSDVMPLPCCCMTTLARHTACLLHAVKTVVWHVL